MQLSPTLLRTQQGDPLFRWRGGDVSRLEALSDGVFALSLTLLVVPFEVGGAETFEAFRSILTRAPVLVLCFAFILMVWQAHFRFHRRFGLEDGVTLWLDGAFLFVLLLGVYPLKLLATLLVNSFTGLGDGLRLNDFEHGQVVFLMQAYAVGFGALFVALFAMNWRAWAQREALELDAAERCLTRGELQGHGSMVVIAAVSFGVATAGYTGWSGLLYASIGVVQGVIGARTGSRAARLAPDRLAPRADVREGLDG